MSARADAIVLVARTTVAVGNVTVTVDRTNADTWILEATLAYITTSPTPIHYREEYTGTFEAVIEHAKGRAGELADLKETHDSVHERINAMSGGEP